jgi:hypothetical protein
VAFHTLKQKNFTPFFGKAKVMEFVKCKNFEKRNNYPVEGIKKGPFPALCYASCFCLVLLIWEMTESRALSKEASNDFEVCFTKNS